MASVQETTLGRLLDDLVRAFGAGDDVATQSMIETFVQKHAIEGQYELMSRGRGYYDALRQLAGQIAAARARGDTGAIAADFEAFRQRHASEPTLIDAGARLASGTPSGMASQQDLTAGWTQIAGDPEFTSTFTGPGLDSAQITSSPENANLTRALAEADEAIEYGMLREAIRAVGQALNEAPAEPRIASLLQTLLNRSPDLAAQVRNLLEPFEARIGREGTDVLLRARGLLDQGLMSSIGVPLDGATTATRFGGGANGYTEGNTTLNGSSVPSGTNGAEHTDGRRYDSPPANGPTNGASAAPAGPPPNQPPVADPHTDQLWQQAMGFLTEGRIQDMIRLLRMIPQGDRHYLPAQAYLETYRPGDPEMQRVAVELARLIVQNVGTLLNLGDRRSLEQVRDRMIAARRLIDEYNVSHPDRPMEYPRRIDEIEEPALRSLQAYAAWDRAEWGLNAGLPAQAMTAFHEFTRLEPNRARLPESNDLRDRIERLGRAMEVAQRFQGVGVSVDLTTLGMSREDADQASQMLIGCAASAQRQAQQDAMSPANDRPRVTMQHVSMIEEYRDLLRIGLQLLELKPKSLALREIIPTAESVTSSYESFRTSAEELRELIWQYESSNRQSLQQLSIGAANYVRNVLEGETNTLLAAADRPGLADTPFTAFLNQAYTLLQLATTLEIGAQRLGTSPDPRTAQSQSIRGLAERIDKARRARTMHNFTVRVLQPVSVVAGVVLLLAALYVFTPLQEVVTTQYAAAFPAPTATPRPPGTFPVYEPDPRTLQVPPACVHENGFNICDDNDGGTFMTHWKRFDWYFGKPISPKLQDATRANVWVQYFEGGRLEVNTWDNRDPVSYGNLGDELLKRPEYAQLVSLAGVRLPPNSVPGGKFILGPNIHIAPEFIDLYDKYTAQLFGLPVLEAQVIERNGKRYRSQWFQRTHMEVEVETSPNPDRGVTFSTVGREYLQKFLNMQPR